MDNLYFDQGFENTLYSEQEKKEMYIEVAKTKLKMQGIGALIVFFILFLEGVIFYYIGGQDPEFVELKSTSIYIILASFIQLIIWALLINKSKQIRKAINNNEGFYEEVTKIKEIKVPTYSWIRFGRSKRLDFRLIQFIDSKVLLYNVYPKLKKIFELNSNDITFKFKKDNKKFWIQTPSKRHAVYFISKYEEKIKNYLIREGYKIQDK